ncbi:hypothetical protein [uncultured Thiohalocapsa sp.]|uniref:hypothetical protein n=1 Tax=uncultured Thiohalocapsa sp. TaxID=768990 RepID=UPI0025EE1BFA|nr:hypothetical protein [uncultured Thiohalocapsa sp.]
MSRSEDYEAALREALRSENYKAALREALESVNKQETVFEENKVPTVTQTGDYLKRIIVDKSNDQLRSAFVALVGTLTLLYRKELFGHFSDNPHRIVAELADALLPDPEDGGTVSQMLESLVRSDDDLRKLWDCLSTSPHPHYRFFYWSRLPITLQTTGGERAAKTISRLARDGGQEGVWFGVAPSEKDCAQYDTYCDLLHDEMRRALHSTNFVLLDSIDVGSYYDKGLLVPIWKYGKAPFANLADKAEEQFKSISTHELEFSTKGGKQTPGVIDTHKLSPIVLPITLNWHLPARSKSFSTCSHPLREEIRQWARQDRPCIVDLVGLVERAIGQVGGDKPADQLKFEADFFVPPTNDAERPIVPMQLASGAHVTYSLFAYTAKLHGEWRSLLRVERDPGQSGGETYRIFFPDRGFREELRRRIEYMFKVAFCFAPVLTLCLDQQRAADVRSLYKCWFDPCLPIEGVYFQKLNVSDNLPLFSKHPARGREDNSALTCIGGYCIAVLNRLHNSSQEAEKATEIAGLLRKYFLAADFSGCLPEKSEGGLPEKSKRGLPDLIPDRGQFAVRPAFPQWRKLEEAVSEITRTYFCALFWYRAVWWRKQDGDLTNRKAEELRVQLEAWLDSVLDEVAAWATRMNVGATAGGIRPGKHWDREVLRRQTHGFLSDAPRLINEAIAFNKAWDSTIFRLSEGCVEALEQRLRSVCLREGWAFGAKRQQDGEE